MNSEIIKEKVRNGGVVGAGGAGFPTYAKWGRIDELKYLMINHQESEENCVVDKWTMKSHADEIANLLQELLVNSVVEKIVISAKEKDYDWMKPLVKTVETEVHRNLPKDIENIESDISILLTGDVYEYGMESLLLQKTVGTTIGKDLPMSKGWIVQNTETMYNIYKSLSETPVTHKLLHVDGYIDGQKRANEMYRVPVGTPAIKLFEHAGYNLRNREENYTILDGGPGWSFRTTDNPVVTKSTNCLIIVDDNIAKNNRYQNGRHDLRDLTDWSTRRNESPTKLSPTSVSVPLEYARGIEAVDSSVPSVSTDSNIKQGQKIAVGGSNGFSVPQHAPLDGEVRLVSDKNIVVDRLQS